MIVVLQPLCFSPARPCGGSYHFKTKINQVALCDIKQLITTPFTQSPPVRKVKTLEYSSFHTELLLNSVASPLELTLALIYHCRCPEQYLRSPLWQQEHLLLKSLCVCSLGACNHLTLSAFRLGCPLVTTFPAALKERDF